MHKSMAGVREAVLGGLALAGSAAADALGGWDAALQTLVFCMALDYLTGVAVAGVFHRSDKSEGGNLDSRAGFRGLCKKGAELGMVLIGARLDQLLGGDWARTAVILFLIGNEGLSVLENLGLMGAPYPQALKNALEVLRNRGNQGGEEK